MLLMVMKSHSVQPNTYNTFVKGVGKRLKQSVKPVVYGLESRAIVNGVVSEVSYE